MKKQPEESVIDRIFAPSRAEQDVTEKEDVSKIIKEWLDPKHIDAKTRFTPKQVIAVTILGSLAETYKIKTLKRFLRAFKTAKLSEGGKSSEELENILKNRLMQEDDAHLKSLSKFLD